MITNNSSATRKIKTHWALKRALFILVLAFALEPLAACYCGCDGQGESCVPTAKGASKCYSGVCIHKCANGREVNQCAGVICDETPCSDGYECVKVSGNKHVWCVPEGICSGSSDSVSFPSHTAIFSTDGWTPRRDQ